MDRVYACIDLKTFFASVECIERGLDPFKTDLIVADVARSKNTICLAITPKMKARGIKNRCRYFEIPKNIKPIIAKPRMNKYIEYSARVINVFLKYVSSDDMHVYSIDEAFLYLTPYLKLYNLTPKELVKNILKDVYDTTGLTAAAGIGTNMYLTKIALDIIAKKTPDNIGYLDEEIYKKELWHHRPLTDFWQIGNGISNRLAKLHLKDMYDIANCNEKLLYKEFGINAKYLINHAWGRETCTIEQIKKYKPKSQSISNSQILFRDYNYIDAKKVLIEMIDNLLCNLVDKKLYTDNIGFFIGYSKDVIPSLKVSKKLEQHTNSYKIILSKLIEEYDYRVNEFIPIRRIGIYFGNLKNKAYEQLDLFNNYIEEEKEEKLEEAVVRLKSKYGKNTLLRGVSYMEGANQIERNKMVGGHNAG